MATVAINARLDEVSRQSDECRQELRTETKELKTEIANLKELIHNFFSQSQHTPRLPPDDSPAPYHPNPLVPPDDSNLNTTPRQPPDPTTLGQMSVIRKPENHRPSMFPGNLATRITKVEFPKFDGSLLKEWLCRCEQFFLLDCTAPELKVRLASLHLEGKALQWHHNFMSLRFDQFPSWPEYVVAISTRFGKLFDDPLADLVSIKQSSDSVEEFLDKFECNLTRLTLSEPHALSIFFD